MSGASYICASNARYEFYPFYKGPRNLTALNNELAKYQSLYNTYRPHENLDLMTPAAYYQHISQKTRPESHMW